MKRNRIVYVLLCVCILISGCASTMPGTKYMSRYERAQRLYQEKKYEETLKELKPVFIHFPTWAEGSLLYARASRATGTIEGRAAASKILVRLVSLYPDRTDIRHELAGLYFEQGFLRYAKTQCEILLKANSEDSESHYMLGLIMQKNWKKYGYKKDLGRMITEFTRTVEIDTLNKEALSRLAVAYLEKEQPDSMQSILDRLVSGFPSDADAMMLSAIACHERGDYKKELEEWNKYFSVCDAGTRQVFDDITLLLTPQERAKYRHLPPKEKEQFVRRFWKRMDPTPTTELNERILEHWRRVGISKLLFSTEGTGTPGWRTGPGEALIRYGFPEGREYTFTLEETGGVSLPTMIWHYSDEEGPFDVSFLDYSLSGEYQYFEFGEGGMPTAFDRKAFLSPTRYDHDYGTKVYDNLFASAGFLRKSRTQEELYIGVPMEEVTKGDWRKVPLEAVIFDSLWNEVARVSTTLDSARTYAESGARGILIRELSFGLAPGKYVVALAVTDSASGTLGLTKEDITVPSIALDKLSVSDIELAYILPERRVEAVGAMSWEVLPNPTAVFVAPSPPRLYYEVYNLAKDRDGRYRFVTRYSIVPAWKGGGAFWGFLASIFTSRQNYIVSSFDRQVDHPMSAEQLSIDLSALKDGSYNLVLEVEDLVSRQRVRVERPFDKVTLPAEQGSDASTGKP